MAWSPPLRRVVFPHRDERLASSSAYGFRGVQSLEHRFLARRLLLRIRQRLSRLAVHGLQANHVLAAQRRIEPVSMALPFVRWQTSRVISGVSRSPAGVPSASMSHSRGIGNEVEKG